MDAEIPTSAARKLKSPPALARCSAVASMAMPMALCPESQGGGVLYRIAARAAAAPGEAAFTVACDMPFLLPDVARLVTSRADRADVVLPRVGGQLETLHACYAKSCLAPMERRLRAGQLKIIGFFGDVRVLEIAEAEVARFRAPELVFMNVNTPEELARARTLLSALEPA